MIFVAVGTQFSFDRLIQYMDKWAGSEMNTRQETVIAQTSESDYVPQHIEAQPFMDGAQYNELIKQASVFVSHAGMGNIISARELETPIIVMNRQHQLGEHRNDHQAEGLKWMAKLEGVYTASTQEELYHWLAKLEELKPASSGNTVGSPELSNYIADFILKG